MRIEEIKQIPSDKQCYIQCKNAKESFIAYDLLISLGYEEDDNYGTCPRHFSIGIWNDNTFTCDTADDDCHELFNTVIPADLFITSNT